MLNLSNRRSTVLTYLYSMHIMTGHHMVQCSLQQGLDSFSLVVKYTAVVICLLDTHWLDYRQARQYLILRLPMTYPTHAEIVPTNPSRPEDCENVFDQPMPQSLEASSTSYFQWT